LSLLSALTLGVSTLALTHYSFGAGQENRGGRQNDHNAKPDSDDGRDRDDRGDKDDHHPDSDKDKVLYIWAQDQAQIAPDFLAVVDFDEQSPTYGEVITTVPVPPPGNTGNEPHHCHLNSTRTILGCGGLLSLLKNQNGIFFFDVRNAKKPRFMFSARAVESAMTDDFLPLENGGFLITQMGSAEGMAPGRVAEFDGSMHFV
jgi:selenium-binding protein 1